MFMEKLNLKILNLRVGAGALVHWRNKYPALLKVLARSKRPSNDWAFFMTIAATGSYLLYHYNKQDRDQYQEEYNDLLRQLSELDPQMPDGLDNLFDFIDKKGGDKIDSTKLPAMVGFWVLWNI